jgi:uncharacterized OB-fold protein
MAHISLPSLWRSLREKYRLQAKKCSRCGKVNFPPRKSCMDCGSRDFSEYELPSLGKIYSYTIVSAGSTASEYAEEAKKGGPFPIAVIELTDGTRIMAQLTDCEQDEISVGKEVELVFRRMYEEDGVPRYGYKFRLRYL